MILEECEAMKSLMERYKDHQQKVGLIETLKPRRDELEQLKLVISEEVRRFEVFRMNGLLSSDGHDSIVKGVRKALESLARVREGFSIDPKNLTRGRDYPYLTDRFNAVCGSLKSEIKNAWKAHVTKACPVVDEKAVKRFEKTERELVRAVRSAQQRAQILRNREPTTALEFQEADSAFRELRDTLERLPKVSDNPEIQAFLDASIHEDGAPLSLLTPDVQQWLYEEGRDGHYRIWTSVK